MMLAGGHAALPTSWINCVTRARKLADIRASTDTMGGFTGHGLVKCNARVVSAPVRAAFGFQVMRADRIEVAGPSSDGQ